MCPGCKYGNGLHSNWCSFAKLLKECKDCGAPEGQPHAVSCQTRFNAKISTDKILQQAAETFRERNAVYKDNTKRAGEVMAALFPEGVTLHSAKDQEHYHLLVLIAVKLTRHTVAWPKGHQDSIRDLAVYSAMVEALIQ